MHLGAQPNTLRRAAHPFVHGVQYVDSEMDVSQDRPAPRAIHAETCELCHGSASSMQCTVRYYVANLIAVAIVGGGILILTTAAILLYRLFT